MDPKMYMFGIGSIDIWISSCILKDDALSWCDLVEFVIGHLQAVNVRMADISACVFIQSLKRYQVSLLLNTYESCCAETLFSQLEDSFCLKWKTKMADQRIQIKGFKKDITSEIIFNKYTGICE